MIRTLGILVAAIAAAPLEFMPAEAGGPEHSAPPVTAQETRPAQRWTDGMFEYEAIAPTAGYFVPRAIFRSERPSFDEILAGAQKMSADELEAYTTGTGGLKVTEHFPLFTYELIGPTAFLWKGRRSSGQQQILPQFWDGEAWDAVPGNSGNADSIEALFGPKEDGVRGVLHVLIMRQSGLDPDVLQTERTHAAKFPGIAPVLRAGLEKAEAVVYLRPNTRARLENRTLDCLKGSVTAAELEQLPLQDWHWQTLIFLRRDASTPRLWFAYHRGVFRNESGEFRIEEYARDSAFVEHVRWALATGISEAASQPIATLTLTTRGRSEDGWMRVEIAAGRERPGSLYDVPRTRSGRDRGDAAFSIRIRRGEHQATVAPRGRFGAESFAATEPEQLPALECEYRFVDCGVGVIKIEIRPLVRPWTAEIQVTYEDSSPWNLPEAPVTTGVMVLSDG